MSRTIQPKAWEEAQRFVAANKRHCNATAVEIYAATVKIAKVLSGLMDAQGKDAADRRQNDGKTKSSQSTIL